MTNFERIKSMSVDELSEFLENASSGLAIKFFGAYISRNKEYIKIWLESEVTHDDGLE